IATLTNVPLGSLPLSPHDVTATYSGDSNFNGSGPSAPFLFGDQKVNSVLPINPVLNPPSSLSTITLNFNRAVDATSINASGAIQVTDPNGNIIGFTISSLSATQWQLSLTPQTTSGVYTLTVAATVADAANFPMDQNGNGINGEVPADQ